MKKLPEADALGDKYTVRSLRFAVAAIVAMAKLGDASLAPIVFHLATLADPKDADAGADLRVFAATALSYVTAPGVAGAVKETLSDRNSEVIEAGLRSALYLGRIQEGDAIMEVIRRGGKVAEIATWYLEAWSGEHPTGTDKRVTKTELDKWWSGVGAKFSPGVCYRSGKPIDLKSLVAKVADDPLHLRDELRIHTGAACFHERLRGNPVSKPERAEVTAWWKAHSSDFPPGKLFRWGRTFEPSAVD